MIRIRNFGNDKDCADIGEVLLHIQSYRGLSVSIHDTEPNGKLLYVDVAPTGEVRQSYGANEIVDLEKALQR